MDCDPVLTITGGDPLLHANVWDFLETVKTKNIPFSILGNPFHLSVEVVKRLEDLGAQVIKCRWMG